MTDPKAQPVDDQISHLSPNEKAEEAHDLVEGRDDMDIGQKGRWHQVIDKIADWEESGQEIDPNWWEALE